MIITHGSVKIGSVLGSDATMTRMTRTVMVRTSGPRVVNTAGTSWRADVNSSVGDISP